MHRPSDFNLKNNFFYGINFVGNLINVLSYKRQLNYYHPPRPTVATSQVRTETFPVNRR